VGIGVIDGDGETWLAPDVSFLTRLNITVP